MANHNLERQRCVNLSMLLGRVELATGSSEIASPLVENRQQPPMAPGDSLLILPSERRRIVAQVRRKVPKNRGLLLMRKFCT
jgi:hypothetical protein